MTEFDGSGPSVLETGQAAASLKEELTAFAAIEDESARGQKLVEIVDLIVNQAGKDTMDNLVPPESPFQGLLAEAVSRTLETPIKITEDAEPTDGWKGHGTAVALTADGEVVGTFNRPTGLEGEPKNYGDLRRYALIKAMCNLHLDKAGKSGGIGGNWDYLEGLGLKGYETLFAGAADKPIDLDGKKVFVASSGIEATRDTIADYITSAFLLENKPEIPKPAVTRETLAGFFDEVGSNRIARNLVSPALSGEPIVVPPHVLNRYN